MEPRHPSPSRRVVPRPPPRGIRPGPSPAPLRRLLRPATVVLLLWLTAGPASAAAQRTEREARGFVESIASVVYHTAWPTATYEGLSFGAPSRVGRGYDVPIRLYGRSGFGGGRLWMELVLELRDGRLSGLHVRRHNAVLAPPFATAAAIGDALVAVGNSMAEERVPAPPPTTRTAYDRRVASYLVGTWRDENSVFTYRADGRWWSEWESGSSAGGAWTVRGDTLTWYFDSGTVHAYVLRYVDADEHLMYAERTGEVWRARRLR